VKKINWHRIFGLTLADLFLNSGYEVILEKELSSKKQFLDIAIIRRTQEKPLTEYPDGLEELAEHNLITYKSMQEPLTPWAIDELIGHYVNYRKQESTLLQKLIPEGKFKLFAICTRYPHNFKRQSLKLEQQQQGIYNLSYGIHKIKLLVLNKMPKEEQNALWQLFSGSAEGFIYGSNHYNWHSMQDKAIINKLYEFYKKKGATMPYTIDDFVREYVSENIHVLPAKEVLQNFSPKQRLEGIPPEQRLEGIPPEQRLEGIPPEQRLEGIPPEQRLEGIPLEKRLAGISPETIKEFLKQLEDK
jgi:hypothetical protein